MQRNQCCLTAWATVFALVASAGAMGAEPTAKIGWYGTLADGLAAAQHNNRPILLVTGAPHCHGISGIW